MLDAYYGRYILATKQMKALIISFLINLLRFCSVFIFPCPFFHLNV
jgi:hypothetical protein